MYVEWFCYARLAYFSICLLAAISAPPPEKRNTLGTYMYQQVYSEQLHAKYDSACLLPYQRWHPVSFITNAGKTVFHNVNFGTWTTFNYLYTLFCRRPACVTSSEMSWIHQQFTSGELRNTQAGAKLTPPGEQFHPYLLTGWFNVRQHNKALWTQLPSRVTSSGGDYKDGRRKYIAHIVNRHLPIISASCTRYPDIS